MKRSVGVTVWAVLLILSGVFGAIGATISLSTAEHSLEQISQSIERLKTVPTGTEPGQLPPERVTQLQERLERLMEEVRKATESPLVKTTTMLAGVLSVLALCAGIGLLASQGWARSIAIWQAACSIVFGVIVMCVSPQRRLAEVAMGVYEGLMDPKAQQMMHIGHVVGQWLGLLLLLVWNGLIIWYFNRPSVKALFSSTAQQQ